MNLAFHNYTYDLFTFHETSAFIIFLTKSWGLEKNISYGVCFGFLAQYFFLILNSWSNHAERSFKITKPLTFFKCFSIWIVSKMSMDYGEYKFFLHINACDPYAYLLSRIHSYQDSKVKHKWSFRFLSVTFFWQVGMIPSKFWMFY